MVLLYNQGTLLEQIEPVDLVIDTLGGEVQSQSWALLKPGGLLVSIVEQPSEELTKDHDVKGAFVFIQPSSRILRELNTLVEKDQLMPFIEHRFPLDKISEAHLQSQSGRTRGKIVIDVS